MKINVIPALKCPVYRCTHILQLTMLMIYVAIYVLLVDVKNIRTG